MPQNPHEITPSVFRDDVNRRCTPEERAQLENIDRCWCPYLDCLADAAENFLRAQNACGEFPDEEGVVCLASTEAVHEVEIQLCREELFRCRGVPDPRPPKRFSASQIATIRRVSSQFSKAATAFGFAIAAVGALRIYLGTTGLSGVAVGLFFAFSGACIGWKVLDLNELARDPPDPDFNTISQPEPPTPPVITPADELSAPLAELLNAILTNQAESVGFGRAVVTAINKAQAAEAANDLAARDRQLTASRGFAMEWASVLEQAAPLRGDAANLAIAAFGTNAIPMTEAILLRSEIVASGWPTSMRDSLAYSGMSGQLQEEVLRRMTIGLQDLSALTVTLADIIAARVLDTPEEELVVVLREFASGVP